MATTTVQTTCTMDCPDTCALEVSVADGRIAKISGSKDHPVTGGFICDKISRFAERVYHPDRLLYPMRRTGPKGSGQFERISWDEAIAEISARFREIKQEWGGEAILPYHYGGSNGMLGDGFLDDFFFARLGASRLARTLCAAVTGEVTKDMYGKMPGVAFEDYPLARMVLIWGANPKASNIHLAPFLRRAKKNGAYIAVVDPVTNFTPAEIDLHLPVFPGADLPVALAMVRIWKEAGRLDHHFLSRHAEGLEPLLAAADAWTPERAGDEARVNPLDICKLADIYARSSPAVIRSGWGPERNLNGGHGLAAILAMPALLGKFGVRGGGYTLSNGAAAKLETKKIWGQPSWETRVINMSQLGEVLNRKIEKPIKGLFIYNCNPVVTAPDQNDVLKGLTRSGLFTVVHEQVMTDTAQLADIVLPAVTFLEQYEIKRGYGSYVVGGVRPVIEPCGEAKPNEFVFAALGRAMGFQDEVFSWDTRTLLHKAAGAVSMIGRVLDPDLIEQGRIQLHNFPGPTPVQFETVFPKTANAKIQLTPSCLGPRPFHFMRVKNGVYGLALVSSANNKMISSTLGEFNYPELWVTLNPRDASARGIAGGDAVRVVNELGEVHCRARLSDRVREGVVVIPKGAWRKSSRNGRTATALCPAHVNEVAGGACYNDARVEVEKT